MLLMGIWSSLHRQLSWFADQTGKWFDAIMRPWLQYQIRICFRNISWDNLSNLCRAWQPGGFVFLDPPGFNHHIIESHHGRSKQPLWLTDWWFGIWNIFPYIGKNHPNWLIFFRGVETTNQLIIEDALSMFTGFTTAYPPLKPSSNTNHVKTLIAYTVIHSKSYSTDYFKDSLFLAFMICI